MSSDGEATATASLVFTVTGRNDNPVPGIIATQTTDDNAAALAQDLKAGATDPDTGDTLVVSGVTASFGETGDATPQTLPADAYMVDANGDLTFDPSYFDDLNVGESATVTVGYTLSDGHGGITSASFTFVVQGVNDAAVFGGIASAAVNEDTISVSSQVSVTDIDNDATAFALASGESGLGAYGTFTISADGTWSYALNDNAQTLNVGYGPVETFDIVSADGTPSTVSVTVSGINDAATFAGTLTGSVAEDVPAQVTGQVVVDDVDSAEFVAGVSFVAGTAPPPVVIIAPGDPSLSVAESGPFTVVGDYGSFTITESGAWTYAVDARANALLDEDVTETFRIVSSDGTPQDIVITVNGTDDPTVFSESSATTTEDAEDPVQGVIAATDPDSPTDFVANIITDAFGTFTIDATGAWTFQVNTDGAQVIPGGETDTLTFRVETTGGGIGAVTINIAGLNNPAEPGRDT